MVNRLVVTGIALLLAVTPLAAHADPKGFVSQGVQPFQGFNPQGFSGFNPPVVPPGPAVVPRHHHHRVFVAPPPVIVQSWPSSCWAPGFWAYQWIPQSYYSGYYQQVWVPERWVC